MSSINKININGTDNNIVPKTKTINGESILGSGNIVLSGSSSGMVTLYSGNFFSQTETTFTLPNPIDVSIYKIIFIKINLEDQENNSTSSTRIVILPIWENTDTITALRSGNYSIDSLYTGGVLNQAVYIKNLNCSNGKLVSFDIGGTYDINRTIQWIGGIKYE